MERNEAFNNTDHYRCRLCGKRSPITETVCSHPGCRAQLSIHGEIILAGAQTAPPPQQPPIQWETDIPEPKLPVKEKKKTVKEKTAKSANRPAEKGLWSKRTTLICLDCILLLLFCIVALCAEEVAQFDWWRYASLEDVLLGILVMSLFTALLIFLAATEHYVWHAVACFFTGFASFVIAGAAMEMPWYTLFFFLVLAAAYGASGVLSFIGLLRRKRALAAGSPVPAFMRKKALLIVLESIVCVLTTSILCMHLDLLEAQERYFRPELWEYILSCFFLQVFTVGSILLAVYEKYIWRSVVNCGVIAFLLITAAAYAIDTADISLCFGAALPYLWLGVISVVKESSDSAILNT